MQNGTVTAKLEKIQSENVVPQTAQAAASSAVPPQSNVVEEVKSGDHAPIPATTAEPPAAIKETLPVPETTTSPVATSAASIPSSIPPENVHKSPDGSAVNLPPPEKQPAFPQQTAEYIAPATSETKQTDKSSTLAPAAAGAATTAAATATAATLTNGVDKHKEQTARPAEPAAPHAPAMPEPGPVPQHQLQVNQAVAEKLAGGDSVSTLPAQANGTLPHPEVLVSSDQSKGLALESEKIENLPSRPQMDRFVTAAEF
jgi:hypothetical protein